jgi:hypothetical protein
MSAAGDLPGRDDALLSGRVPNQFGRMICAMAQTVGVCVSRPES